MMKTRTAPGGYRLFETHIIDLPACCPVSHNPRPGSTITIMYRPMTTVLDVIPLPAYLRTFIGGKRDDTGKIEVRDMEQMVQRIADDCMHVLHVPVRITAHLVLWPNDQSMRVHARAYPLQESESSTHGKPN